ncbi:hypothetical protein PXK30_06810 [Phaeobacter gallaeciensis]|uniref:hypothetical protein n=1 Tax=Phaeobacter gallaeciensis TaxID=60890 RepID=UPI00237F5B6E|nr:hypothetical protein [Phaeobacter gallaeciensis]MDE4302557.1 hypothetical protein [Phaeobacter gallaeciensis]MDE4307349.1 hypothetical protein [Phaeobacter gallaeciensis]MDE4311814.1 hypothetical protein [Phaeobacter gallaeciensis]MDE4315879.1 hypothetical protein [Phaeobacter gallaeciensis]MDE4320741.1 hypothetical protein [Phaeobacter gallaeciensis]
MADFTDKDLKKRLPVTISSLWWKSAWPGAKPPSSGSKMTAAIKSYKEAKRDTVQSLLVTSLNALTVASKAVRKDANSLSATPKRKKAILDDLDKLDDLIKAEHKAALKFGNKTREVYRYNFADKVKDALKGDKYCDDLKLKGKQVVIELLEAIVQELDQKNALNMLHAQYSNALEDTVKKAAAEIRAQAKARVGMDAKKTEKALGDILNKHASDLADLHHKVPTNVLKKMGLNASLEAQYQKDLKKRRVNIAKSVVMTTASGVAIGLPGTQALAIYGFVRSTADLTQQLIEHNMKITQAATLLQGHLKYLAVAFDKASKGVGRGASETLGTTLNAALGIDLVPTLDKAKSSLKDLKVNTAHAGFKTQKLTNEIMNAMDSCKSLDKTVNSLSDTHPYKKILKKNLKRNEKSLNDLLDKTAGLAKSFNTVDRKLPHLSKALAALGKNSKLQDGVNYTAKVLVQLGAIAGGGLVDATHAVETADSAVKLGDKVAAMTIASVGYADELRETGSMIKDLAKS